MAQAVDERHLNVGLDFDTHDNYIADGRTRYVLHGRSGTSDSHNVDAIESMRGNMLRDNIDAANAEFIIGSCPDVKNNATIQFVYRLNGNHYIKRYYATLHTTELLTNPVLMGPILNFQATGRINNPRIIDAGYTQFLIWTEVGSVNPPRLMNIDLMKNGGAYYSFAADSKYINLIKTPPLSPPTALYSDDTSPFNTLVNVYYQFRYRYIFIDYQKSTCSQISDLTIPNPLALKNNVIHVVFNSGHHTVVKVELMVRIGNGSSDTGDINPEWYIFKTIDKSTGFSDNTNYQVLYFGNESLIPIARIETDKNFEAVPQYADRSEYVTDNQILLGAPTEGYDNVALNVSFDEYYGATGIINCQKDVSTNDYLFKSIELPVVGETFYIRFFTSVFVRELFYPITANDLVNYPANIAAKIIEIVSAYGYTYTYSAGSGFGSQSNPPRLHKTSGPPGEGVSQLTAIKSPTELFLDVEGTAKSFGPRVNLDIFSNIIFRVGQFFDSVYTATATNGVPKTVYFKYAFSAKRNQASGNPLTVYVKINGSDYTSKTFTLTSSFQDFYIDHFLPLVNGDTIEIDASFSGSILINCTIDNGSKWTMNGFLIPFSTPGFKSGTEGQFGLIYYDEEGGRNGGVNTGSDCIVNWQYYSDRTTSLGYEQTFPIKGFIPQATWEIKHIPPLWARKWGIVFKKQTHNFTQTLVSAAAVPSGGTTDITVHGFSDYDIEKGDQVIIIGEQWYGVNSPYSSLLEQLLNIQRGYVVLDFDVSSKKITLDVNFYYALKGIVNAGYSFHQLLIEIRKPKQTANNIYFEISQLYEIGNPGQSDRYHAGESQDQDPSNPVSIPAKGIVTNGDVYYRLIDSAITESLSATSAVESNFWNQGRIQVETPNQRHQKYGQLLRWGGRLFPNTQVNNLCTWDEGNYNNTLNQRFGDITGLLQRGYTLDIIQWGNTSKAFLGRKEMTLADGSTQLVVTDNLIGTINPSRDEFGTKQPGTVVLANGLIFFWDTIKGVYCMDAGNGIIPISEANDAKAKLYWRDASKLVNSSANWEAISGMDFQNGDMYVTMKNTALSTPVSDTIIYNVMDKKWKTQCQFETAPGETTNKIVQCYGGVGQTFISWMQGSLWEHNALVDIDGNPVYLKFYGINRQMIIEFIANIQQAKVKVFDFHSIHTNIRPDLTKLSIAKNTQAPIGMYTELTAGNYELNYLEGVYYSEIRGDAYTHGIPITLFQKQDNIFNGRDMRGQAIKVRMEFDQREIVVITSSGIGVTGSPLSL